MQDSEYPEGYDWPAVSPYDHRAIAARNEWIEIWRAEGESYRQIGRRIGRSGNQVMIVLRKAERRRQRERERIEQQQREIAERIRRFDEFTRLPGLRVIGPDEE